MIDGVSACSIQCWVEVGTSPRRVLLCWIPSRWSLPPGVLARAHALHHPHYPHAQGLPPPYPLGSLSRRFLRAAQSPSNNPLRILSESIYLPYQYSSSLMTDSRHSVCPSPFHSQHPSHIHFNHCTHITFTITIILYRIMPFKIIQVVA